MQAFSGEHIKPRSQQGQTTLANLAWACQGCNNHKYNRSSAVDLVTGRAVPLFHPRRQQWADHFIWNQDASLIIGITATGRATVEALQLNRKGLVNLRRILVQVGQHPPATL